MLQIKGKAMLLFADTAGGIDLRAVANPPQQTSRYPSQSLRRALPEVVERLEQLHGGLVVERVTLVLAPIQPLKVRWQMETLRR